MRRLAFILLVALALVEPAVAQQAPPPPQRPRPAPVAPTPPPVAPARPAQSFSSGGIGSGLTGFQPLPRFGNGLVGLAPAGDPTPQCRADCAKAHNECSGAGDDQCESSWTQCVLGCRTGR